MFNPYRVHRVRFESPLCVVDTALALAATDKTRLGSGLHACQLRVQVDGANILIDPLSANVSFTSGQERLFRGTLHRHLCEATLGSPQSRCLRNATSFGQESARASDASRGRPPRSSPP